MDLPDYEFLPAPFWLLTILHVVTLTIHFLAMNFLVGGLLIVLFSRYKDRWQDPTVQKFVKLFPSIMAATVSFGVAPLLFLQAVYHRQVYAASITSGWFWLMIFVAAMFSYYLLYAAAAGRRPVYLLFAIVGLLYISLVYSSVFTMAEHPDQIAQIYATNQAGLGVNPVENWLLRWLHMILGALTVGGFFMGVLSSDNPRANSLGFFSFVLGMLGSSLVGAAYMMTLKVDLMPLMRTPAMWILLLAMMASLASVFLFIIKKMLPSGLLLGLSVLGMVLMRHYLRLVRLGDDLGLATVPVRTQWDVFLVFLVCFLGAIGLIVWMLYAYFNAERSSAA
jgi:hypothetical protein